MHPSYNTAMFSDGNNLAILERKAATNVRLPRRQGGVVDWQAPPLIKAS